MKDLVISAKCGKADDAPSGSVTIQAPESFKEAVEVFGEEALLSNAMANWTVLIQGRLRGRVSKGISPEVIQQELGGSVMGVSLPKASADPVAKVMQDWDKVPDDIKAQLLVELKEKLRKQRTA